LADGITLTHLNSITTTATLTNPGSPSLLRLVGQNTFTCSSDIYVNIEVNEITDPGVITGTQTICLGQVPVVINSTSPATVSDADATVSYSWYYKTNGDWEEFNPKITTASYTPAALTTTTLLRRQSISDLNGMECSDYSNTVTVTVAEELDAGVASSTTKVYCFGDIPSVIEDDGTGETINPSISFEWEISYDNGTYFSTGVFTAQITPTSGLESDTYYRRVTKRISGGVPICEVYSDPVLLRVNDLNAGTIQNNFTVCDGDDPVTIQSISLGVGASGDGNITYRWEYNTAGVGWGAAAGVNNASNYITPNLAAGDHAYRRGMQSLLDGVSCPSGGAYEYSNTVTVTVADVLTAGTATTTIGSALGDNVICSGDTELDIEIDSGEAAAPDIRFIWQTSPDDANWTDTAQTNETFTRGQALFANTYYRRVAQRMSGGVPICSINSASVLVKVNTISAGSLAIAGSTSETICYNTSPSDISFDVAPVAYGGAGTVSYTWYRSDRNATDTGWLAWTEIAGVDSPTLSSATISDLTVSTRFYATVSSTVDTKECTANTNEIIVEVIDEISNPNFSVPATGTVSVCYGESPGPLTFTNADTGGPFISGLGTTFSYSNQWFSSTVSGGPYTTEIAGATALSYTPPALTSDVYYVLRTTYTDNNGLSCTSTSTRMISVLIDDLPSAPGVTILMPGTTTPTLVAQNQVNRITIGGAPANGEEYYAVVNGILNSHTVAGGFNSPFRIAQDLAAEIDNDANISAVANGVGGAGTIEVTGDTPGDVVTISVSRSSGAGG
jgi:hypothetical protein